MNAIEQAFANGVLSVEVDAPQPLTRQTADFLGAGSISREGHAPGVIKLSFVHVMSKPARGEIRGYVLIEGEGLLRLRLPCYTGDWPEMDDAVLRRVPGATGLVVGRVHDGSGMVLE